MVPPKVWNQQRDGVSHTNLSFQGKSFSELLLLAFWLFLVKVPLTFVFYTLWILGLILHKQTLLNNPRGDLSRFCIFGSCRKTSRHFGDSAGESNRWHKRNGASKGVESAKRWCFSHQLVIPRELVWCFIAQEEHCEVELEKVLSLAHWATGDDPNRVTKSLQPPEAIQKVKDGGRINFLIQGKNISSTHLYYYYYYF